MNAASRASDRAGIVRAMGTSTSTPRTSAKWSCIFGRTGAMSTAPRMGRQALTISSVRRSRCPGPDTGRSDGMSASAVMGGGGGTGAGMRDLHVACREGAGRCGRRGRVARCPWRLVTGASMTAGHHGEQVRRDVCAVPAAADGAALAPG